MKARLQEASHARRLLLGHVRQIVERVGAPREEDPSCRQDINGSTSDVCLSFLEAR